MTPTAHIEVSPELLATMPIIAMAVANCSDDVKLAVAYINLQCQKARKV